MAATPQLVLREAAPAPASARSFRADWMEAIGVPAEPVAAGRISLAEEQTADSAGERKGADADGSGQQSPAASGEAVPTATAKALSALPRVQAQPSKYFGKTNGASPAADASEKQAAAKAGERNSNAAVDSSAAQVGAGAEALPSSGEPVAVATAAQDAAPNANLTAQASRDSVAVGSRANGGRAAAARDTQKADHKDGQAKTDSPASDAASGPAAAQEKLSPTSSAAERPSIEPGSGAGVRTPDLHADPSTVAVGGMGSALLADSASAHARGAQTHLAADLRSASADGGAASAGSGAPQVIASDAGQLEVGVLDGTHGWLRVRAELGAGGDISASLTADAFAHDSLRAAVPEISGYLAAEQVHVSSIEVHRASLANPAPVDSTGAQSGGGQADPQGGRSDAQGSERTSIEQSQSPRQATDSVPVPGLGTNAGGRAVPAWMSNISHGLLAGASAGWGAGTGGWLSVTA